MGKIVKELSVAAKLGGPDADANPRLFAAIEKARKASVTREVIERAVRKGAGIGDDKMVMDLIVFEGYAPHKVAVIVEAYTDNVQRTTPEVRVLFRKGVLGLAGSNKFLFEHVGIVEAAHADTGIDPEEAAIEAGANDFAPLSADENDDIPADHLGARFLTERTDTHAVSTWLTQNGWSVVTAEIGYVAKMFPDLTDVQREEVGEFLQALEDHDDVQRVWAAVR